MHLGDKIERLLDALVLHGRALGRRRMREARCLCWIILLLLMLQWVEIKLPKGSVSPCSCPFRSEFLIKLYSHWRIVEKIRVW